MSVNLKKQGGNQWIMIGVTALVSIGLTAGIIIGVQNAGNKKVPKEMEEFIQEGEETFTVQELENMIESVSELITEKYHYREVGKDEKEGTKVGKLTVPGTAELTLIIYSGTISAGIDVSEIECDIDQEKKSITITMPEPKIVAHEIDESSIESYDVKSAVFSKKSYQDYAEKIAEFKETKIEELTEDGTFFDSVKEGAQETLTTLLTASALTKDYEIVFTGETEEDEEIHSDDTSTETEEVSAD